MNDWNAKMEARIQKKKQEEQKPLDLTFKEDNMINSSEDSVIVKIPRECLQLLEMPMINANPTILSVAGTAQINGVNYFLLSEEEV